MQFNRVDQVRARRLCLGCGACVSACPSRNITLVNVLSKGLRPRLNEAACQHCGRCVDVCPGISLSQPLDRPTVHETEWGPILQVWEGYAAQPELRYRASSGGLATAMAYFCIAERQFAGALHIAADKSDPIRNIPVFSSTYEELLDRTGSRYAPAGPCEKFEWIEEKDQPCVFIGKPCDMEALDKYQSVYPDMAAKVGLSISIFCAGTPSTQGTLKAVERMNLPAEHLTAFRYRGYGWPGLAHAETGTGKVGELTYDECWGQVLSKHVQFRCRLCPDSTGQFADIACGDPWYRDIQPDDPGRSMVIARTPRGKEMVENAMRDGYVILQEADPDIIPRSQVSLLFKRRNLWARLLALRMFGLAIPDYRGFGLFRSWRKLSARHKAKSFFGTVRRIIQRKWYQQEDMTGN